MLVSSLSGSSFYVLTIKVRGICKGKVDEKLTVLVKSKQKYPASMIEAAASDTAEEPVVIAIKTGMIPYGT